MNNERFEDYMEKAERKRNAYFLSDSRQLCFLARICPEANHGKAISDMDMYSSTIIQNVSDAIIVYNEQSGIQVFNRAAKMLFQKEEKQVIGHPISKILDKALCENLSQYDIVLKEIVFPIEKQTKTLSVSKTVFTGQDGKENTIMVFRDLTELKRLEERVQNEEHHAAIAQLASGVAHEIRNPLNTISTIIQQLRKDFEPRENREEYHQLVNLVYKEAQRINKTVSGFLNFAISDPIKPQLFQLSDLINNIFQHYQVLFKERNVRFSFDQAWDGEVYWDHYQMHQIFMNLIQNAVDAIGQRGRISLSVVESGKKELEIRIHDTGPGIPEEIRSKVFNLYFTTKANGTGIGLSIVRRIVYEHGGTVSFESSQTKGTTFIMRMPKKTEG